MGSDERRSSESPPIAAVRQTESIRHEPLELRINGDGVPYAGRTSEPLVWALRELGLTGTKPGCRIGVCGVCIVLLDGAPVRSCRTPTGEAVGHEIVTIEGLADGDSRRELHPVQRAFVDLGAPQCGWCMSGQVLTAVALLARHTDPSERQIEEAMDEVLCRCGTYGRIRAAVRAAASGATPPVVEHLVATADAERPSQPRSSRRTRPSPRRRLPSLRGFRIQFNQDFFFERSRRIPSIPESPRPWFDVKPDDDRLHLYLPKVEMGQGIHTALAQLAADELDIPLSQLVVHQADLDRGFDPVLFFTADSTSTRDLFEPLRRASARLRERVRAAASDRLGCSPEDVVASNGYCSVRSDPDRSISYAEVARHSVGVWSPSTEVVVLKPAAAFRYIGRPHVPVDAVAKVTGRAVYGSDASLPGMLHGAIARPPRYGARLVRARQGTAADRPGVVGIVIEDGLAGIVADSPAAAEEALGYLELEWEGGVTAGEVDILAAVSAPHTGGTLIQDDGDVSRLFAHADVRSTRLESEYRSGLVAHATLEAQAALVDVGPDRVVAYLSSQAPRDARRWIARAAGRRESQVDVVPLFLGAAFGRKGGHDVGAEAARLSAAVGAPVRVAWSLADDLRHGWFRPPTHHVLRGALDDSGRLLAIEHRVASGDISFHFPELVPGRRLGIWLAGADPHASEGALLLYDAPNRRTVYHRARIPVPTSFFRSVGLYPSTFAIESFIDELAATTGADPLEFRLRHIAADEVGVRLRAVLEVVGRASNWGASATTVEAPGLACCFYRGTAIALVAEITPSEVGVHVRRVTVAVDPGLVVNPDGVRAQVEGAIVMGVGSTLFEQARIVDGMLANDNLDTYRIMRMRDTPEVETVLVGDAQVPLGGVGEIGMGPVGAAIGNAIFALTGERKRAVPFYPAPAN